MLGFAFMAAAILGVVMAFSIHPPNGIVALKVLLPPAGTFLSPEQLAEVVADPDAGFHLGQQAIGVCVDGSFLAGGFLFIIGLVKHLRKTKTVQAAN